MKKFLLLAVLLAIAATQPMQGQDYRLPQHEFTINAFGGLSTLLYKVDKNLVNDASHKMGLGFGAGFGYHFFFSDNWAFVTGIEAALYRSSFTAAVINTNSPSLNNFKEVQNMWALQLPLMVKWLTPLGAEQKNNFYAALGGRLAYNIWGNFHQTATAGTSDPFDYKETLKFGAFNVMGSVELGVRWKLGENTALYTGIYADYGFLNIIPKKVDEPIYWIGANQTPVHNSILVARTDDHGNAIKPYTEKVNNLGAGLKIKFALGIPKKAYTPKPEKVKAEPKPAKVKPEPKPAKEVPQEIKQSMIRLSNTLFAFDKFNLSDEAVAELAKVVKWLQDNPTLHVEIEGHTDSIGTAEYNQKLSESRAKSVHDYFVSQGVSASRLSYRGYSFDRPVATNATPEGRQENRRVELKIIN